MNDVFFYVTSWILVSLGFYSIVELFGVNDSIIKKILMFAFGLLYFASYYKHNKDRGERIEQDKNEIKNKYIERIINKNNKD